MTRSFRVLLTSLDIMTEHNIEPYFLALNHHHFSLYYLGPQKLHGKWNQVTKSNLKIIRHFKPVDSTLPFLFKDTFVKWDPI